MPQDDNVTEETKWLENHTVTLLPEQQPEREKDPPAEIHFKVKNETVSVRTTRLPDSPNHVYQARVGEHVILQLMSWPSQDDIEKALILFKTKK